MSDRFEPSPAPCVIGYLAENWTAYNQENPAVIVNPKASPMDQLAWCWGEATSLAATSSALASGNADVDATDFAAMFHTRLPALAAMLEHAINGLHSPHRG